MAEYSKWFSSETMPEYKEDPFEFKVKILANRAVFVFRGILDVKTGERRGLHGRVVVRPPRVYTKQDERIMNPLNPWWDQFPVSHMKVTFHGGIGKTEKSRRVLLAAQNLMQNLKGQVKRGDIQRMSQWLHFFPEGKAYVRTGFGDDRIDMWPADLEEEERRKKGIPVMVQFNRTDKKIYFGFHETLKENDYYIDIADVDIDWRTSYAGTYGNVAVYFKKLKCYYPNARMVALFQEHSEVYTGTDPDERIHRLRVYKFYVTDTYLDEFGEIETVTPGYFNNATFRRMNFDFQKEEELPLYRSASEVGWPFQSIQYGDESIPYPPASVTLAGGGGICQECCDCWYSGCYGGSPPSGITFTIPSIWTGNGWTRSGSWSAQGRCCGWLWPIGACCPYPGWCDDSSCTYYQESSTYSYNISGAGTDRVEPAGDMAELWTEPKGYCVHRVSGGATKGEGYLGGIDFFTWRVLCEGPFDEVKLTWDGNYSDLRYIGAPCPSITTGAIGGEAFFTYQLCCELGPGLARYIDVFGEARPVYYDPIEPYALYKFKHYPDDPLGELDASRLVGGWGVLSKTGYFERWLYTYNMYGVYRWGVGETPKTYDYVSFGGESGPLEDFAVGNQTWSNFAPNPGGGVGERAMFEYVYFGPVSYIYYIDGTFYVPTAAIPDLPEQGKGFELIICKEMNEDFVPVLQTDGMGTHTLKPRLDPATWLPTAFDDLPTVGGGDELCDCGYDPEITVIIAGA